MPGFIRVSTYQRGACGLVPDRMELEMELGLLFEEQIAEITEENRNLKLAERVGVHERDFAKPNVYNGFAFISRNRND